jgi:hypothetical protein
VIWIHNKLVFAISVLMSSVEVKILLYIFGGWGSTGAWTQGLHTCQAGSYHMIHSASLRKHIIQAQKVSSKPRNRFIRCSMSSKEPVLTQWLAWQTCATKWLPMQGIASPYFVSTLHDCDLVHVFQGHLTEVGFPILVTYTGFVPRWVSVCLQRSLEE